MTIWSITNKPRIHRVAEEYLRCLDVFERYVKGGAKPPMEVWLDLHGAKACLMEASRPVHVYFEGNALEVYDWGFADKRTLELLDAWELNAELTQLSSRIEESRRLVGEMLADQVKRTSESGGGNTT